MYLEQFWWILNPGPWIQCVRDRSDSCSDRTTTCSDRAEQVGCSLTASYRGSAEETLILFKDHATLRWHKCIASKESLVELIQGVVILSVNFILILKKGFSFLLSGGKT